MIFKTVSSKRNLTHTFFESGAHNGFFRKDLKCFGFTLKHLLFGSGIPKLENRVMHDDVIKPS